MPPAWPPPPPFPDDAAVVSVLAARIGGDPGTRWREHGRRNTIAGTRSQEHGRRNTVAGTQPQEHGRSNTARTATARLRAVGLCSVPSWLRPLHALREPISARAATCEVT
eukprot:gene21092-44774_t